ncbi:BON domain-containing protein [Curtobacterium sp. 'Ferrero']|uniref:BON domain-containing protein n=1 Tax=Curtobacterium sp. 'Ferrero' TaxID=2033654 RepID=UPI00159707AE|nr:BON domain-containing protein [Curtobacterium sp. 'Ferrero']
MSTAACAPVPGSLRDRILRAWRAERSLDASTLDVAVDVGGNRVVLAGDVGSYTDRLTAHEVAAGCAAGVVPLENRIVVRPLRCDPAESDDVVRLRVERVVRDVVPGARLTLAVRDHVVRVTGVLDRQDQRRRVHAAVARCPGVHFVDDRASVVDGRTFDPVPSPPDSGAWTP